MNNTSYLTDIESISKAKQNTLLSIYRESGIQTLREYKIMLRLLRASDLVEYVVLKKLADDMPQVIVFHNPKLWEILYQSWNRAKEKYEAKRALENPYCVEDLFLIADEQYFIKPKEAEVLGDTPFYSNSLNLVYGMSKSGKSFSIAKLLLDSVVHNKDVLWLDKDHNVNTQMMSMLSNFRWVNHNISDIEEKLLSMDGKAKILVFDSLKDFSRGEDLDTNAGSQAVMEYIREFTIAGYTVIVIAHATKTDKGLIKIKGNSETITSKADVVYRLNTHGDFREFETMASRLSGVVSGDTHILYDLALLRLKCESIIRESEKELTVRELTNKLPSSIRDTFTKHQSELIEVVEDGRKHIAKCIQTI